MHWILLVVLSFLAGGAYSRHATEDDRGEIYKRLTSECRAEIDEAARDEPPNHDGDR